jgi:hypothetical protein
MALLAVVVLAGLLGFLGVRSRTVTRTSQDGTVEMQVRYAAVARAGLAVPFTITVKRQGGFDGEVRVAVSSHYLELFDRNAIDPQPNAATATDEDVVWQFTAPPGDELQVSLDLQVQAGQHWSRSGTVALLDDTGQRIVSTDITTWLAP